MDPNKELELIHFGVKGMKWGVRNATSNQIVTARRDLRAESAAYRKEYKKFSKMTKGTPAAKAFEKRLRRQHQAYLKNPDRAIAARMTKGEKITGVLFTNPANPYSWGVPAAMIGSSITARVIEAKQRTGAYNKLPTKTAKRIGGQRMRGLAMAGAVAAPAILATAGNAAAMAIGTKAVANRNAAKVGTKAISGVASKLKYAKAGRGGAFKITTM